MEAAEKELPSIGHNRPEHKAPQPGEMKKSIEDRYADLFKRARDLLVSLRSVPAKIVTDDDAAKVGDLMKATRVCLAQIDTTRKSESEEWRRVVAEMNTAFNKPVEDVKAARDDVNERLEAFLLAKADRERLALEERARIQREEGERRASEAAAAEQRRLDAERKAREEQERAEAARIERETQERLAAEATERAAKARAEEEEAKARKKAADEQERGERRTEVSVMAEMLSTAEELAVRDVVDQLSGDEEANLELLTDSGGEIDRLFQRVRRSAELLDDALLRRAGRIADRRAELAGERNQRVADRAEAQEAAAREAQAEERRRADEERVARERAENEAREAQRRADEEAAAQAREARLKAEAEAEAAKARAKEARGEEREALAGAKDAGRDAKVAGRETKAHMVAGERSDARAEKLERKADGPESDLARTRGDFGSVGTLARRWTIRVTDQKTIDLEKLRFHLHPDAIQAAAQHFLNAGGRDLKGAVIEEAVEGRVI